MVIAAEYPFLNILGTMAIFFLWTIWIIMMVQILSDVFRRRDLSGGAKVGWTLFLLVLPFLGALIYLADERPKARNWHMFLVPAMTLMAFGAVLALIGTFWQRGE